MSKRDVISEIREKNARSQGLYWRGNSELYDVETSFYRLSTTDSTAISLHVMGIVSCIEVSVREAIKRVVDAGGEYLERAALFKDHIRFDFMLTKALSTREITFGDLVSHSLPVSKLEQIAAHIEVLFSEKDNFRRILSEVREYASPDEDEIFGDAAAGTAQNRAPFLVDDIDALLRSIASLFELRHCIAHEASFKNASHEDVVKYLKDSRTFVEALYELVEQELNLGGARDGYYGSIQHMAKAGEIYGQGTDVQVRIQQKISEAGPQARLLSERFQESITAFDAYFDAEEAFRLALHGPASGNAMRNIGADVRIKLWQHRFEYLKEVESDVDFYAGHNE